MIRQGLLGYKHIAVVLILWNVGLLIWWYVSLRRVVLIGQNVMDGGLSRRITIAVIGIMSYPILLFPLLVLERNQDIRTLLVVSMVSGLWLVAGVAARTQRRAHSSWF